MTWHALVPLPLNKLLVFLTQVKCCANFPCPCFHCVQTSLIKNKELTYWDFLGRASFIHNRFFSTMSLMTEKPGSSANVNWPLQDCAPRSHAALHQFLVAWDIQAGLQGAAGSSCLALPFPSQGTNVFYQSKSPPNASSQATKMPVVQVLIKNSKLSLFLQTQNPNQPLSLVKPKGWCSRRQSAAEPSEAAPRAGASVGAGSRPCPRRAAGTWGTGGSLIALGCCHVGDSGFRTGAPPETRKNRACPSWCSSTTVT